MRVASRVERGLYDFLDAFNILENLVIPEPKYSEPLRFQPLGPPRVVLDLLGMLPAIQLDNEPRFKTGKVDDIFSKRGLLAKPEPIDPLAPQPFPQTLFRLGAVLP